MAAKQSSSARQARRSSARVKQPERAPVGVAFLDRIANAPALNTVLVLVAVHVLLCLLSFMPAPFTGGDNAGYMTLANSLLHEHKYLELYDPAHPAHTQYPPVFPLIIALAFSLSIKSWVGLKLIIVLFSATAVALSYLWLRRRRRSGIALGAGILLAVSPGVLELSHWELSDVPFWAFTMLALWAFERLRRSDDKRFAIAVIASVLAYFTRSAGLPLVVAAIAWLAFRRRWQQLAIFAGVLIPLMFFWWLRAHNLKGGVDYVQQFWSVNPYAPELGRAHITDLFTRAWDNNTKYLFTHTPILLTGQTNASLAILGLLVAVLSIVGWVRRLRKPGVADFFYPLYIGLLYVWPAVWSGERFLLPALPLVLSYAGEGLVFIAGKLSVRTAPAFGALATAFVLLLASPRIISEVRIGNVCTVEYFAGRPYACLAGQWQDFFGLAEWTRDSLPRDAVVLSRKDRMFYVLSGRTGRPYPMTRDFSEFLKTAKNAGARFVVLDHLDGLSSAYLTPVIASRPDAFCVIHATDPNSDAMLGIRLDASPSAPLAGAGESISLGMCAPEFLQQPEPPKPVVTQ